MVATRRSDLHRPENPVPNFEETLVAARLGEDWAWRRIFREFTGPVTGYLRVRGAQEPEDLASEVLFQVAKGISHFDGDESSFRSWVFVIAHRRLIDARRRTMRRPRIADGHDKDVQGGDVEDEAMNVFSTDRAMKALSHLTNDQRDVLALRVVADLSLAETASILGKEVGAIKSLQRRALLALKRLLESEQVSL